MKKCDYLKFKIGDEYFKAVRYDYKNNLSVIYKHSKHMSLYCFYAGIKYEGEFNKKNIIAAIKSFNTMYGIVETYRKNK